MDPSCSDSLETAQAKNLLPRSTRLLEDFHLLPFHTKASLPHPPHCQYLLDRISPACSSSCGPHSGRTMPQPNQRGRFPPPSPRPSFLLLPLTRLPSAGPPAPSSSSSLRESSSSLRDSPALAALSRPCSLFSLPSRERSSVGNEQEKVERTGKKKQPNRPNEKPGRCRAREEHITLQVSKRKKKANTDEREKGRQRGPD